MKLYNYWRSSSSWRVRIVLAFKSLPYDYIPVHLLKDGGEQHEARHHALNPMHEVPVLSFAHKGHEVTLTQSQAIMEFLEELHPTPSMMPKDLFLRAKVRQACQLVASSMQPLHNLSVLQRLGAHGVDKNEWINHFLDKGLRALEVDAEKFAGQCLIADAISLADAALVPQLAAARRFKVDVECYPTLCRVEAYLAQQPAFMAAHADHQIDAVAAT